MRHLKRKFETPVRPFDKQRIDDERVLLNTFGLKSKHELWRAEADLRKYRRLARDFAAVSNPEEEKVVLDKLHRMGVLQKESKLEDILALSVNDFLERRLQTVLERKGIANTVKQARQLIAHGHVKIGGRKVVYPSYMVYTDEESNIEIVATKPKTKVVVKEAPAADAPKTETTETKEEKPAEAEKPAEKSE